MSHFSSVTTVITDKALLIESIKVLGYQARSNFAVRGYQGQCVTADVVAIMSGEYDIGFQNNAGVFQATADFAYGHCGGGKLGLEKELQSIIATYAALSARKQAQANTALNAANVNVVVH